jgi:CHAD domain-containing protein
VTEPLHLAIALPGLAEPLRKELAKRLELLKDAAARGVLGGDDDAIHDVRVSARRLEAFLATWRDVLGARSRRRSARRLRRLRRALGETRQLEVHAARLEARLVEAPRPARLATAGLATRWASEIALGRGRAAKRAVPKRLERIARASGRAARRLEARIAEGLPAATLASARAAIAGERARTRIAAALRSGDDATLHAARIALKKWRYAAESLGAVTGATPGVDLSAHRALQERLGEIHDLATLGEALERWIAERTTRWTGPQAAALAALLAELRADRESAVGDLPGLAGAVLGTGSGE